MDDDEVPALLTQKGKPKDNANKNKNEGTADLMTYTNDTQVTRDDNDAPPVPPLT